MDKKFAKANINDVDRRVLEASIFMRDFNLESMGLTREQYEKDMKKVYLLDKKIKFVTECDAWYCGGTSRRWHFIMQLGEGRMNDLNAFKLPADLGGWTLQSARYGVEKRKLASVRFKGETVRMYLLQPEGPELHEGLGAVLHKIRMASLNLSLELFKRRQVPL